MPKTSVLISSLLVAAVVGGLAYWVSGPLSRTPVVTVPIPPPNVDIHDKNAIANHWRWENFTDIATPSTDGESDNDNAQVSKTAASEVPYDVVKIYNVLQTMQLDDYGLVIPNQIAKEALDKGYDDIRSNLNAKTMAEIKELIQIGLPGEAGEEAARVLEQYYEFRLAEEEFNRQVQLEDQVPVIDRYEELVQLRRDFLGDEIADQLFAVEDTQARHMMAAFEIHQNEELSDEEKQIQQAALQQKLNDRLLALGELKPEEVAAEEVRRLRVNGASDADIYAARVDILGPTKAQELAAADREEAQWQTRFNGFWQARRQVVQAGLDDTEKERQIEQLLGQYFSPDEQERARNTSFEWLARDDD